MRSVPGLRFVVVHEVLQQLHSLLGLDLVHLDHVVGDGYLQVLPLLVHLLRDLAGGELAADHPRVLRLLLLRPLEVGELVLVVSPGAVERPLQVPF